MCPESMGEVEFKNDGLICFSEDISVRRALKLAKKEALSVKEISSAEEKPPVLLWDGMKGVQRANK